MTVMELMAVLSLNTSAYEKGLSTAEASANTSGSKIGSALGGLAALGAKVFAATSAALVGFTKSSIDTGQSFESSISQVAATMGTTVDQIQDISDKAKDLGAKTQFTATQAADAFNYLALAGYDSKKAIGNIESVLNLAAAGSMDLAQASDMVTDAMSALGIEADSEGKAVTAFGDQMAKTASKTNTNVSQLGEAILTIGATAKNIKGGTTELNTALGILANNGIKGSEGGTHLRNVLLSLQTPTDKASKMMESLGLQVYDSEGNMRSLNDILGDMNTAMGSMTSAEKQNVISTIFNKADLASVNALLSNTGATWTNLENEIANSSGAMGDMATTQMDNLQGALTYLSSAADGFKLAFYDTFSDTMKDSVKGVTDVISGLTDAMNEGGIQGVFDALPGVIEQGLTALINFAPTAISAVAQILGAVGEAVLNVIPVISEKFMTIGVELMTNMASGLATGIPEFLAQALPMLLSFTENLRANASVLIDAGLNLITQLAQGLINSIPLLVSYVPEIIINICGIINDNAPKILTTGVNIIIQLVKGIIKAIPTIVSNIPKIIQAMIAVFTAFNWLNLGASIIKAIANGVKSLASAIPSTLRNIANSAGNLFKSVNWADLGVSLIKLIVNGIKTLVTAVPNALKTAGTAAFNAFKSISWVSLGANLIAGIASGITSGAGKIASAAMGAAKSALSAAKNFLGIHSPSKVWEKEVGHQIAEGAALGIERNDRPIIAAKSMVNAMGDNAFENTLSGYGSGGYGSDKSSIVKLLSDISEKMDRTENVILESVTNALDNMGVKWDKREVARIVKEVIA